MLVHVLTSVQYIEYFIMFLLLVPRTELMIVFILISLLSSYPDVQGVFFTNPLSILLLFDIYTFILTFNLFNDMLTLRAEKGVLFVSITSDINRRIVLLFQSILQLWRYCC